MNGLNTISKLQKEAIAEARKILKNRPYIRISRTPLELLRYHVTGAIERGEKEAIIEQTT